MIAIEKLTTKYRVIRLTKNHVSEIMDISMTNLDYYHYMNSCVTRSSISADLKALPPKKLRKDKYFLGFYNDIELMGFIDLIDKYPNDKAAYIGLFMLHQKYQGNNIAAKIIKDIMLYFKANGYNALELGYVRDNIKAVNFWSKLGFVATGEKNMGDYIIIKAQLVLH